MKTLKKILILSLLLVLSLGPTRAFADVGPKPSVNIEIENLPADRDFYITLLAKEESTGPYSVGNHLSAHNEDELRPGYEKFKEIKDRDGYNFLAYLEKHRGPGRFSWSYYPPKDFKVAIYDPEKDLVLISEPIKAYAFNSNFEMDYVDFDLRDQVYYFEDQMTLKKASNYPGEIKAFALRLALTIVIEYLVALIFFRPTAYQRNLIIKTNVLTQGLLNLAISFILYYLGFLAFFLIFIPLELIVFIIEGIIYKIKLNQDLPANKKPTPAYLYAFLANLASGLGGYYLVRYLTFFS